MFFPRAQEDTDATWLLVFLVHRAATAYRTRELGVITCYFGIYAQGVQAGQEYRKRRRPRRQRRHPIHTPFYYDYSSSDKTCFSAESSSSFADRRRPLLLPKTDLKYPISLL